MCLWDVHSEPWMVARVAAEIADLKRISYEDATRQLTLNAAGLFGIPAFPGS
ncbi:MAG: hypothetical protein HYY65_10015 [Candidatus Tectomicrobia bacterium]|uniref:Hydrolase TatD n=1 Tax=Tectimicrobiota bacterium TaxID=2528274 RepID=A0A932GQM6_UNCTE|nr:hypothetical protein [Candidatus Tectomicrobia bacterium]